MKRVVMPNAFFAQVAERLRMGKRVRLMAMGDSMYPIIRGGEDEILLRPLAPDEELPLWCAPFYEWNGQWMIHRLIRREGKVLVMLGDGNLYREERVEEDKVAGVLARIYRPDGTEVDCLDPAWLRTGQRWYRLRPVRRYLLFVLKRMRKLGIDKWVS